MAALWLSALLLGCSSLVPHPLQVSTSTPDTVDPTQVASRWLAWQDKPVILLGELHDDPTHPPLQRALVQTLVAHGRLAALVLEMAEQGRSTQGLPTDADEATAQAALAGNLPRVRMRKVMDQAYWDGLLDAAALADLGERVRQGHCGLLPDTQIPGMVRVQVARDRAMADTVISAWRPGGTVLLLAGNEHVRTDVGVPNHLRQLANPWPANPRPVVAVQLRPLQMGDSVASRPLDTVWPTPPRPPHDHCAALRRQLRQSGP